MGLVQKFNPYTYIPCLKGNHEYELDPLFSNILYVGQGRSKVQGRGSPNTIYLMWDSHTTFDFAAEEDLRKGMAPSRLKLMGVELEHITMQVPGPEDERWGSIVLEWAVLVDPEKELSATQDSVLLARLGGAPDVAQGRLVDAGQFLEGADRRVSGNRDKGAPVQPGSVAKRRKGPLAATR